MTEWKRLGQDERPDYQSRPNYAVLDVSNHEIEKDDILNVNNNRRVNVHADSLIKVGQDLNIEIAQNSSWVAGELFEQICELFDLEGYDEVHIQGPAGETCD